MSVMAEKPAEIYLGLSGIKLPVPKYQFPPEHQNSSRLSYYATFFNTIEVNSSFYKIPMSATVSRWAASVTDNFRFTFKLFRGITHNKELSFKISDVEAFLKTISWIGQKRSCLLVQFPPSLTNRSIGRLEKLLFAIRHADPQNQWKVAVEFRSKGWYHQDLFELLENFGATLVLQDLPTSASPMNQVLSDVVYVRFHGPTGNYRGSYSDAFLHEYAGYITEWLSTGKTVYIYFNNTAGDAFNNCQSLARLLRNHAG